MEIILTTPGDKDFKKHCPVLPSGCITVGLISRHAGINEADGSVLRDPGALVIDPAGMYRQVNFGILRTVDLLDQDQVLKALSVATVKQKIETLLMVQRNVTLDANTVLALRDYGDGNLSEGIRRAAKLIKNNS